MHLPATAVLFLISLFFCPSQNVYSQTDSRNWSAVNAHISLSKKTEVGVSHLRSYSLVNSFKNNFNESAVNLDYEFSKRFSSKFGVTLMHFPSTSITTNRLWVRSTFKARVADVINWYNGLQGEHHSENERRFRNRVIYQTRVAPVRRIGSLRLSPSVSYWLYYFNGGDSIQYYDGTGSPLYRRSADGIHRGRFKLNLNSKISQTFSVSLYYLSNNEFNLTGNKMNVKNYSTGKISRPFNNYQVIGLSVNISLAAYKQKTEKPRTAHQRRTEKDNTDEKEN